MEASVTFNLTQGIQFQKPLDHEIDKEMSHLHKARQKKQHLSNLE